jgi:hypothetical protein
VLASICVIAAVVYFADAGRRALISTKVPPEKVVVSGGEIVSGIGTVKSASSNDATESKASESTKKNFKTFLNERFSGYYLVYARLAKQFNKPEDRLLTREELANELGYTLDSYTGGDSAVVLFVDNQEYATQIQAAADLLGRDARVTSVLSQYQTAQKTAQQCTTQTRSVRGWDSTSTACANWYSPPVGCAVMREEPYQQCYPAYPDGITSPLAAFIQLDHGFREVWAQRTTHNQAIADAAKAGREAEKARSGAVALKALYIGAAFLVAMFLFLVVAIERHLRRLALADAKIGKKAA